MRRAAAPDAWAQGSRRLLARENWGRYLAGIVTETAYALFLIGIPLVCAVIAELIAR